MKKIISVLKSSARYILMTVLCVFVLAVILFFAAGGSGSREANLKFPGNQSMLLFAHRGSGNYFPENSIEGFEASLAEGFKAIETDVRVSADDTLIIFHDDNCMRLLGMDTSVTVLPSSELKKSQIIFNGVKSASTVISVDDLFSTMKDRLVIYLDVKLHDTETAGKITALIRRHHLESTTIVANSNMLFIAWIEFMHPEINTVLEGFTPGKEWLYTFIPKNLKPDFYASFASDVNSAHMEWIKSEGLAERRIVYGVDRNNFHETVNAGIQKIIMDYDSTLQEEIIKYR